MSGSASFPILGAGLSIWLSPHNVTTVQTQIRIPAHIQLCSTGFPARFRVTAFSSPLHTSDRQVACMGECCHLNTREVGIAPTR